MKEDIDKYNGDVKALYLAVKNKEYKLKHHKKELNVIAHKEIVKIAKQLKQIRTWLDIPLPSPDSRIYELSNAFSEMSFQMGSKDLELLCYE